MKHPVFSQLTICIKGAGEMASGLACRLYAAGLTRILMLETARPQAVRRAVSFCEAVYDSSKTVEDVTAALIESVAQTAEIWQQGKIAVYVDPAWESIRQIPFDVIVDAILAKKNLGTTMAESPLVIGLGPGFTAGEDVHCVIETHRGHNLGRVIYSGMATANTGIPGEIARYSVERVVRSPIAGVFRSAKTIGSQVKSGERLGQVDRQPVLSQIDGVVRGLIRDGSPVIKGCKLGDVDPRGDVSYCFSVSEKARSIGGAVLEALLAKYNYL